MRISFRDRSKGRKGWIMKRIVCDVCEKEWDNNGVWWGMERAEKGDKQTYTTQFFPSRALQPASLTPVDMGIQSIPEINSPGVSVTCIGASRNIAEGFAFHFCCGEHMMEAMGEWMKQQTTEEVARKMGNRTQDYEKAVAKLAWEEMQRIKQAQYEVPAIATTTTTGTGGTTPYTGNTGEGSK